VTIKNKQGEIRQLPKENPDCYEVYQLKEIGLSKGDKIRITKNGFDKDKRRLNNGQILEVETVRAKGAILLRNKQSKALYVLADDFGHISHAHCITSHSAQGRTTDVCLVSQPAATFSATDAKQFYVSVSRAREQTLVYTDDKEALLEAAAQAGDRRSALELLSGKVPHMEYVQQRERNAQTEKSMEHTKAEKEKYEQHLDLEDYEPRF
jgi:ATP-dependent exoDNAse (exonuclease V) alpha subunit